jgi:hypothetical protein
VNVRLVRREVQELCQPEIKLSNEESSNGEPMQSSTSLSHLWVFVKIVNFDEQRLTMRREVSVLVEVRKHLLLTVTIDY